jgi:hypothetical protein
MLELLWNGTQMDTRILMHIIRCLVVKRTVQRMKVAARIQATQVSLLV